MFRWYDDLNFQYTLRIQDAAGVELALETPCSWVQEVKKAALNALDNLTKPEMAGT